MLVDVSCARGVKWAAWHLQLQPLGLNKGRSLAAFPTQLSPFYHGFHSCFISSVSLHRVHTMRRHLGRVHSSVFSIFFPPVSGYFSFLLSFFFFFFCSPPADQSQSDGNPSDSSVATHSQIVSASSLNFYDHGGVARTWSHLQIGFRFQFRSYYSSRSFLFDWFIRVWIGKRFRSYWSIDGWIHWIPENRELRGIRKFIASTFSKSSLNSYKLRCNSVSMIIP